MDHVDESPGALAGATGAEGKADGLPLEGSTRRQAREPRSAQERWRHAHPKAYWAHQALRSGIRRGLLSPQPCAVCGDPKAEGHHPDYDRPLVVEWLCRAHHKAAHAKLRRAAG